MELAEITTVERAKALPELPMDEFHAAISSGERMPLSQPMSGDTVILFVDDDGDFKEPCVFRGQIYKRAAFTSIF